MLYLPVAMLAILGLGVVHFIYTKVYIRLKQDYTESLKAHKKTEQSLREQDVLFRVTLESIGDGVISTDIQGIITFMNPVAEELTGYGLEETKGKHISHIFNIINESTREPAQIPINTVLRSKRIEGLANHTVLIRKDGTEISIADSAAPITDDEGDIKGVVMVFRDVTAQREIDKSMEQLAFIVSSSREAIFSLTPDGIITSWNFGAQEIYGYEPEEVIGNHVHMLANPGQYEEIDERLRAVRSGKGLMKYETVRVKKGGLLMNVLISISPVLDDASNLIGLSVISHNITDRVKSQEMLLRYKLLSDAATNIILFVQESDGRIIEANDAAQKAYGYTEEEFLGLKAWDLFAETEETVQERLIASLRTGQTLEATHKRKDGSSFSVEISASAMKLAGESMILGIIQDITERKSAEQQLIFLSLRDQLSGIYNRGYFEDMLDKLDQEGKYPVGIIIADIDGLKMVNDTFGHNYGDDLIKAASSVMQSCVGAGDILCRIGGDEFAIIMPHCNSAVTEEMCYRIRKTVNSSDFQHLPLPLRVSLGFAVKTEGTTPIREVVKLADNNMYREKLYHSRGQKSGIIKTLKNMMVARDINTQGHADRIQELLSELGKSMGMTRQQRGELKLFAAFHDMGKVGISDNILLKPGELTHQERERMKRHSEIGHRIALSSPELAHIAELILLHHEWWDGNGYPLGLKGDEIPLECRMLSVVDAYDAMISDRPYRRAMTHEEAVAELKRYAGTQFDPTVVEMFLAIFSNS